MSTECYYSECKYHGNHYDVDCGPFCDELECQATEEDLKLFQAERDAYLESIDWGKLNG